MPLSISVSLIRILFLEDSATEAELSLRELRVSGMQVDADVVSSPEQFKERARQQNYDLILGDYRVPSWTGLDAVRWLRAEGINTPFILVTNTLGDELAIECIRGGASDVVPQDKLDRLPSSVLRVLDELHRRFARGKARRELRRSEQKFASIVRNAPFGIYRSDESGRILMTNPAMVNMLGYESEDDLLRANLNSEIFWNPDDRKKALRSLEILIGGAGDADNEKFYQAEVPWRRKDGLQIMVRLAGRRLPRALGTKVEYEVFVQDVTEQRTLARQFLQAQKMEAIGRLAGGVAHDFNNLLMIIRGCAELLDYHKGQPAKVKAYLRQINEATSIAASVVQQLMAFSRKQAPETGVLDLNGVLKALGKMLPRLLGEDVVIEFKPGPLLHSVNADRIQVEQIILNLAVNARDAMPAGGKLVLKTRNQHLNAAEALLLGGDVRPGDYVVLAVKDSGVGMNAEVRSHIFEPFFTTKERGKGTGLGLATVWGSVKQSGGVVSVESSPGQGCTFRIYFPRADAAQAQPQPVQTPAAAPGGSETILLVEDEAALREITQEYLQSKGYRVLSASNGMQALEICRTHREPINILLTDIVMPGIHGPALVEAAIKLLPGMRIIYVSGYSDRSWGDQELGSHAIFLHKPYGLADLAQKIRTVLAA